MTHRNDDMQQANGGGHTNDGFLASLQAGGATGVNHLNDAQRAFLVADTEPVAGFNDMWWSWLGRAPRSFIGALPDRFKAYWRGELPAENSFGGSFGGSFE